jgi:predicted enzyme related to lactoylglutathione lyase
MISRDPDATASFYASLFGWRVNTANAMGYRRIESEEGVSGGIWPAPPQAPNFVQLFTSVEDVAGTVRAAEALGARVIIPPTVLPEGDEMAVLHDPQGMSFGVCRRAK